MIGPAETLRRFATSRCLELAVTLHPVRGLPPESATPVQHIMRVFDTTFAGPLDGVGPTYGARDTARRKQYLADHRRLLDRLLADS